MPSHSHRISNRTSYMDGGNGSNIQVTSTHANAQVSISAGSTGGSQPHNNMPPYLTVYAWKRTA